MSEIRDDLRIVGDIGIEVARLLESSYFQSAKQDSGDNDWCVWIGGSGQSVYGVACFTLDERARRMDDDFIRELAAQVLGYAPDSVQDLERRLKVAQEAMAGNEREIAHHRDQHNYWFSIASQIEAKLAAAREVIATDSR